VSGKYDYDNSDNSETLLLPGGIVNVDSVKAIMALEASTNALELPFSVTAISDIVQCSYFTKDTFLKLFGPTQLSRDDLYSWGGLSTTESISTIRRKDHNGDESFRSIDTPTRSQLGSDHHGFPSSPSITKSSDVDDDPDKTKQNRHKHSGIKKRRNNNHFATKLTDECFVELGILGKGSFGTVFFAKHVPTNSNYALKRINKIDIKNNEHLRHLVDECKIMLMFIRNPFIAQLFGVYQTPNDIVLVLEPLTGGDLWGVIFETKAYNRGLPLNLIKFYTACITHGLAHMHSRGVAFRDLKPENILLDIHGYLYITDFGFAKKIPYVSTDKYGNSQFYVKSYTLCGTPGNCLCFI
jgi:protein kinase A